MNLLSASLQPPSASAWQRFLLPGAAALGVTLLPASGDESGGRAARLLDSVRDPAAREILVAAHRGGYDRDKRDQAPENSLAGLERAVARGYHVYETDIRRTRDGAFVIVHDDTLDRETDGQGPVEELTLGEVKRLQKRYRDGTLSGQPVAMLEELLAAGQGRVLFKADPKPGVMDHYPDLARLVSALGMQEHVFLRVSRREAALAESAVAAGAPALSLMIKVDTAAQAREMAARFSPDTIQVNLEEGVPLSPGRAEAIRAAREAGILVQTHCPGDPAARRLLIELGVRMFHTADPVGLLRDLAGETVPF